MAKQKLKKVLITQVKSTISQTLRQKRTISALGLGKINRTVEKELSPQVEGMINKVNHLIKVKEIVK
ncbi:MAG: 50S ribosomal protein L30 [Flammeovirgaceae bacterium]|jgi:large subunit ribosomal protein L30|nr:50S ribosomal protein L30 [Flammeovirgaceae bacterium]|tara:strand:- start:3209 stop:3409 length:201 start_codon:yes stop_codon:yes gene_type:complete